VTSTDTRPSATDPDRSGLRLVGADTVVPLVTGGERPYVNLDYAASAPALVCVADAVSELLEWYSSVHRGAGFKSRAATAAYEGARESIRSFVGARDEDAVIITRNTTDSINLLATALPEDVRVIGFAGEHHANLLPWQRRGGSVILPVPTSPGELLERLEDALRTAAGTPTLVTVTGASNVTGEVMPLTEIAALTHRYDARLLVDAAQLAPHHAIDMAGTGIDYLALSGHKLYAPFGAGALIGRGDWLGGTPFLAGGGAVKLVTVGETLWADLPDRQEAGSPNVVGAVALGVACDTLSAHGMDRIEAAELDLWAYARSVFASVPGWEHYRLWGPDHPRVGLFTFNLRPWSHDQLAAVLSAEHGIGVRHGCFCAHPLMMELLHVEQGEADRLMEDTRAGGHPHLPGAARISFGVATTRTDVDAAAAALRAIATDGPAWTYAVDPLTGEFEPDPDPRPMPSLPFAMAAHHARSGEST
jgi:selenocysteine lyase/cysteine desulfurase